MIDYPLYTLTNSPKPQIDPYKALQVIQTILTIIIIIMLLYMLSKKNK